MQILGEEHGGDHAQAIVHDAGLQKLPHASIDHGEARGAAGPALKVGLGARPGQTAPVGSELMLKDLGVEPQNGEVKLPPCEFLNVSARCLDRCALRIQLADADQPVAQILAEQRGRLPHRDIATRGVAFQNAAVDEVLHALTRRTLARGHDLGCGRGQMPVLERRQRQTHDFFIRLGPQGSHAGPGSGFGEAEPVLRVRCIDAIRQRTASEHGFGRVHDAVVKAVAFDAEA